MYKQELTTKQFNRLLQKHGNRIGYGQVAVLIGLLLMAIGFIGAFTTLTGITVLLVGVLVSYAGTIVLMDSESFIDKLENYSVSDDQA